MAIEWRGNGQCRCCYTHIANFCTVNIYQFALSVTKVQHAPVFCRSIQTTFAGGKCSLTIILSSHYTTRKRTPAQPRQVTLRCSEANSYTSLTGLPLSPTIFCILPLHRYSGPLLIQLLLFTQCCSLSEHGFIVTPCSLLC